MGNLCSTPSPSNKFKQSTFLAQEYKGVTFEAVSGDIIEAEADAIVNGTNPQLSHNNGLGNNLLSKGGQVIQEESDKIRAGYESDLPIGTAVITQAGHLKARYIIHVVTPIWTGGSNNEEQKLGECVLNALTKAEENRLKSIAVPSLAGGLLEFPKEKASKIIVQHCVQYLDKVGTTSLQSIKFINTNAAFVNAFKDAVQNTLRAAETGENINLAREETEVQTETGTQFVEREREEITIVKTTEDAGRKEKRAYLPPQEDEPVVQHQQEIRDEKPQDVIVEEKHVDIIHQEKPVEELRHESPVVEHRQEEVPVVEEKIVVEEKPVEQPVVEEKQEEVPVAEQKKEEVAVEEKPVEQPVVEEKVVEEEKPVEQPVVEEKVIEEEKPVEQPVEEKQEVPVVEEKQEEAPVVEHKQEEVAVEEKPVEQPVVEEKVIEEEKPVEQPVEEKVEEKTQETEAIKTEQEESKTQEVKQSEETEENKENDDATTQADTEGGNQAEGAEEEGNKEEEGASKKTSKKNKKNKKKN